MAGYMPDSLFEAGAYTIAMNYIGSGVALDVTADELFLSYKDSYLDDNIRDQWVEAAEKAIDLVETQFPGLGPNAKTATLKHLQTVVLSYEPDGKRRKKKLFGGTIFDKSNTPNEERAATLARNFAYYNVLLVTGQIE